MMCVLGQEELLFSQGGVLLLCNPWMFTGSFLDPSVRKITSNPLLDLAGGRKKIQVTTVSQTRLI